MANGKVGAPSSFTEEQGDLICSLIAEGKSLRTICKLEGMPHISTIMDWVGKGAKGDERYTRFAAQYAHAMELRTDAWAEEIVEICDDDSLDMGVDDEGKPFVKGENIQRSRLRIDTRKWLMGKHKPKKYGEKIAVGGDDDAPPIKTQEVVDENELARRMAFLLGKAALKKD